MVGTDEKFGRMKKGRHASQGDQTAKYAGDIQHMRRILGSINPDAAELIAYQNAERIFK